MVSKFSIIIACFNAEATIKKCFDRIREQQFKNFQLFVIDGGSTDNTIALIRENNDVIDFWISEPDKGIYDAWNKGLKYSSGEWILFIGADDFLLPNALKLYNDYLEHNDLTGVLYISSKVRIISSEGIVRRVFGWPWNWKVFRNKHIVAHPGSLHYRSLFQQFGDYDTTYKIAGDYELLLRPKDRLNARFVNAISVEMSEGGASVGFEACREARRARIKNVVRKKTIINISFAWQLLKLIGHQISHKLGIHFYLRREFHR